MVKLKYLFLVLTVVFALPITAAAESNEWELVEEIEIEYEKEWEPESWNGSTIGIPDNEILFNGPDPFTSKGVGFSHGNNYSIFSFEDGYTMELSRNESGYLTSDFAFSPGVDEHGPGVDEHGFEDVLEYAALSHSEAPHSRSLEVFDLIDDPTGNPVFYNDFYEAGERLNAYSVSWLDADDAEGLEDDILAVGAGNNVYLFNVSDDPGNWTELNASPLSHSSYRYAVDFSNDGSELASGGPSFKGAVDYDSIVFWNTSDWEVIEDKSIEADIFDADYSDDDKYISGALGNETGGVVLETDNYTDVYPFTETEEDIVSTSFHDDTIIYGSYDNNTYVIDASDNDPDEWSLTHTLDDAEGEIYDIAFDGKIIASISADHHMRIYSQVEEVNITPEDDQTITAGETIDFNATAYDAYGNIINEVEGYVGAESDLEFNWDAEGGSINGTGYFDETEAGDYEVTAEYGGTESEPTTVTVEPGFVNWIDAADTQEEPGVEGEIEVTAYDEYDNPIENETIDVMDDGDLTGIDAGDTAEDTDENGVATFTFNESNEKEYTVEFAAVDIAEDSATVTITEDVVTPTPTPTPARGLNIISVISLFLVSFAIYLIKTE